MGTPTYQDVEAMNPDYKNKVFPSLVPLAFETNFPAGTYQVTLDFLEHLLVYDPNERPSAIEALAHPFFNDLRTNRLDVPGGQGLMPMEMFNFTQEEYNDSAQVIEETTLIPEWLPKTFMSHINRYAIAMHPTKSHHKGTKSTTNSPKKRSANTKVQEATPSIGRVS